MKAGRRVVMAGGGTGGHVFPALAVAEEMKLRGWDVMFVGTDRGLEARLVPQAGFAMAAIDIGGWHRVGWARAVRTLIQLPGAILRSLRLIRDAAVVFSTGGYAAGPVAAAALLRGIPVVILEPNAVPGLTHRLIARRAARVLTGAAGCEWFPQGEASGVPVRGEFFRVPPLGVAEVPMVVLVGGSQGSRTLNRAFRESWPLFRERGPRVRFLHQCGPAAYASMREEFAGAGIEGEVVAFITDMPAAYRAAHLVVSRAGASALAELAAAGRPALLVPFPFAAGGHQKKNAEAHRDAGAARLVEDAGLNGARLYQEISDLIREPRRLAEIGAAARRLARPEAARRAADAIEQAALPPGEVDR